MTRTWLKRAVVALVCAAGWLTMTPQPAQAQVVAIAAGVWGWRNIVAPRIGGPFVAPEVRVRPFGVLPVEGGPGIVVPVDGSPQFIVPNGQAQVVVRIPDPNAQVWVQGVPMQLTGQERVFSSPPLDPGFSYTYEVRARWRENQQTNDQTRTVRFGAGDRVVIDFGQPMGN
jgi:uncharacterized protein (TIGR03000 family)